MPTTQQATKSPFTLYGSAFKANPFPVYAAMRNKAPVCYHAGYQGTNMVWFISHYEKAMHVLRNHKRFVKNSKNSLPLPQSTSPPSNLGLFQSISQHLLRRDGQAHQRVRRILEGTFHGAHIMSMKPRIQNIADTLLDGIVAEGHMDVIQDFAFPLSAQIIAEILGVPTDNLFLFRRWTRALSTAALLDPSKRRDAIEQRMGLITYLKRCFELRRSEARPDLMSQLVQAQQVGHLSEAELFSTIALLCVSGHETTVKQIGNGLLALLQHPAQYEVLRSHPELLEDAIEELIRYNGSVERATTRFAAESVELGGQLIQRGDAVVVVLASANRDATVFDDPDTLDVIRKPDRHLGFGYGLHYCLGASLARLEVLVALEAMLLRLPNLRLAIPLDSLEWTTVPALRGVQRMPVIWG